MVSFVCVKTIEELKEILSFEPDFIAIEPPELIGTKKSISSEKPALINECHHIIKEYQKTQLICGAGINKKEDIKIALETEHPEYLFQVASPNQIIGIVKFLN